MSLDPELDQWRQDWQQQHHAQLDVDQLRRAAKKHDRWDQLRTALEIFIGAITLILAARAYFLLGSDTLLRFAMPILGLILIGAITRNVLMRRRLWTTRTLDVTALLTRERQRIDKRIRYWRGSTWFVTALWSALALIAVFDSTMHPHALDRLEGWFLSLFLNLFVVLTTAGLAFYITRRARNRRRLLDELEHPENIGDD